MKFKPNEQYDDLLNTFYQEMKPVKVNYPKENTLGKSAIYETIKKWKPADKTPLLKYLIQVIDSKHKQKGDNRSEITFIYQLLMTTLFKSTLGFTESSLKELLTLLNESREVNMHLGEWPITHAVNHISKFTKKNGLSEDLKSFLEEMITWEDLTNDRGWFQNGSLQKSREKLDAILFEHGGSGLVAPEFKLSTNDKLGTRVNKKIDALGIEKAQYWHQLFDLAYKNAESSKPTKKYLKESTGVIQNIGEKMYYDYMKQFFDHIINMKNSVDENDLYEPNFLIDHFNSVVIKGLIWTVIDYDKNGILDTLAALAERCFKKDPGPKPASLNIGNACVLVIKTHAEE